MFADLLGGFTVAYAEREHHEKTSSYQSLEDILCVHITDFTSHSVRCHNPPRGFAVTQSAPPRGSDFSEFVTFLVALNATVGSWATLSLNICDFTRFARSRREQLVGQSVALPTVMTFYGFISVAVTSATVVIYGGTIWDPTEVGFGTAFFAYYILMCRHRA